MKKQILLISAAALSAITLYAASARLDFFNRAGEFFSILESDLLKISYLPADENNPESGFDRMKIETVDGERIVNMAEYSRIGYAPATGKEPFAIEVRDDGHCKVNMIDCLNNDGVIDPTKPNDWHGAESDYTGHFLYEPEYGYEMEVEITGQWTGKVYTEDPNFIFFVSAEDYAKWTDSWGFHMPNEPIYIDGKSTEFTTYAGRDFVGEYKGYEIRSAQQLYSCEETELTMELRANGSYTFKTTDENAYDLHFMYDYDEERNRVSHVQVEQPKWDYSHYYGASGPFIGDGYIYMWVVDYTTNDKNDMRYYLASKAKFTQTCASGEYGKENLIEAVTEDGKVSYVYVNNYGAAARLAEVSFISGTGISGICAAIVSYDGEARFKFVNDGDGAVQFVAKGLEAGTYQPNDGISTEALVLDGFGRATIGGATYTYEVESGVVTLENGRVFNIDTTNGTYQEVVQNDEWTGPTEFYIENGRGAYGNVQNERSSASIIFDKDLMGNDNPGFVALKINTWDSSYASVRNLISANPKYIYNKSEGTVVLSGVLVGTGTGYDSERRNLVLRVADDLKSMWFDETANGDKIYGVSAPTDYFYTGAQNTLTAPAEPAGPEVKGTYTATFSQIYYMGSPMSINCTASIAIDKSFSTDKPGYAFIKADMNILFDVVEYEVSGSKLILKNIEIGTGDGSWAPTNLEFEITAEGNLQGSGIIYGNQASTCLYGLDLGSVEFIQQPAE